MQFSPMLDSSRMSHLLFGCSILLIKQRFVFNKSVHQRNMSVQLLQLGLAASSSLIGYQIPGGESTLIGCSISS
jgi:hypothetical protein